MRLYRANVDDNALVANLTVGTLFIEPNNVFEIKILANGYTVGEEWTFTTYPINSNLEINDFTVPILSQANLVVNVTEQLTNN